jgi:Na+/serine symporter
MIPPLSCPFFNVKLEVSTETAPYPYIIGDFNDSTDEVTGSSDEIAFVVYPILEISGWNALNFPLAKT